MKHTPGPWRIDKVLRVKYNENTGERLPDETLLFIYPLTNRKPGENFTLAHVNTYCVPEGDANAQLIAAAPELKLACEGALAALLLEPHVNKQMAIDYLREAIAKAEGRE